MEQLLIIKNQQRILFRGHPQKNAEYLGWYHITCRHFKESSTCPYDFGKPLMWQFDGGYVDLDDNGSPTGWNYYVTDHLGSTRKVVGSNDSIKETINYYPFGSEMRMQDPAQMTNEFEHPYRFTGKELDRLNGLNMYDFGARLFDVAGVPMWTSVDPLAEKYYHVSPYAYCGNNPEMFVDPDGKDIVISGTRQQRLKVLGYMQALTNDKLGVKQNGQVVILSSNSRNKNRNLKVGTGLISSMISNKEHTATISFGEKNNHHAQYRQDASNGKGTDVSISFNPSKDVIVLTEDREAGKSVYEKMSPIIVLGHELVHGNRAMNGEASPKDNMSSYIFKDTYGDYYRVNNVKTEELETVGISGDYKYTENKLRKEHNLNKRIQY